MVDMWSIAASQFAILSAEGDFQYWGKIILVAFRKCLSIPRFVLEIVTSIIEGPLWDYLR